MIELAAGTLMDYNPGERQIVQSLRVNFESTVVLRLNIKLSFSKHTVNDQEGLWSMLT